MRKKIAAIFLLVVLLFSLGSYVSSYAIDFLDIGKNLMGQFASDDADATDAALEKYISSGIFDKSSGTSCSSLCSAGSRASTQTLTTCLSNNSNACSEAQEYINVNAQYASYAKNGLQKYDKTSGRLNAALEAFNEKAHFVYSFLTGFGCLTALLVFIIIFVRITWLPEHATQRRKAMEDIVTSGISVILLGGFWLVIGVFQSVFNRFWETYTVFSKDWNGAANIFLVEYKGLIIGFLGIATLTALLMLIKSITGVVIGGSNPQQKTSKMTQVLYCGLATAGLGGLTIFAALFWNVLR